ncbi:MAG: flippase [Desulfuromonadaceae bacterium]
MNVLWIKYLPAFARRRLEGRNNLQKVIGNAGWLFADKILRMGVGLLVSVWLIRYLGPEQFGLLSYALAFVAMFSAVATLGLDSIVVRDIVLEPERTDEILGTAFTLKLMGGMLTLIFSLTVIAFLKPGELITFWLVGLTAAGTVFQAVDTVDLWFNSQTCSRYSVYAKSCVFLLISSAKIVLIITKAPLVAFAWAGLAEVFVGAVGLIAIYRITGGSIFRWRPNYHLGIRLLKHSWPLLFAYMSYMVYMRIDQVMIGSMLDSQAVGLYSAATRIFELPVTLVVLIASSSFPALTRLYTENIKEFYYRYFQITYFFTIFSVLLLCLTLLWGKNLIILFFGEKFTTSYSILSIQIFGLIFMANAGLRSTYLTISGNQRIILITTILSAVMNIVLNYFMIPVLKVYGAALATTITQLCSLLLFNIFFKETRKMMQIQLQTLLLFPFKTSLSERP